AAGRSAAGAPTATPPVTILKNGASRRDGDLFISPFSTGTSYASGPEILSPRGQVIWLKAVPAGEEAAGFRTQTYDGRSVLTWWQGTGLGALSSGTDYIYIYNDHCQQIAQSTRATGTAPTGMSS
ncbi:MAG: hypothetical protein ACRDRJ_39295, partial [Streptosporangiaceae bacterium]